MLLLRCFQYVLIVASALSGQAYKNLRHYERILSSALGGHAYTTFVQVFHYDPIGM